MNKAHTTEASNFTRSIKDIVALKNRLNTDSFLKLVSDELLQTGRGLLTFRNGDATIYYEGRQLCNMPYKANRSSTEFYAPKIYNHYLPIIRSKTLIQEVKKEPYFEDTYRNKTKGACDFASVLYEILDNMDKERDDEAFQVSGFYQFSPMRQKACSTVVLLDIEAAFAQTGHKTDRIDMVLYHTDKKQLIFVEVKRLSDTRLYADPKTGAPAEILDQLSRYRERLVEEKSTVVKEYNKVIAYYNALSESSRKIPLMDEEIAADPLLGLLVVECTNTERYAPESASDQFKALCTDMEQNGFKMHTYGNLKNATPGTLLDIYNTFK